MSTPKTPRKRTRKVEQPPNEKVDLIVEEQNLTQNKYAPKPKIGANRPKNIVDSVGLGKLKVETVQGYTNG